MHSNPTYKFRSLELAQALRFAHQTLINPEVGFLPRRVPSDALPISLKHFLFAADQLPARYHHEGASVRGWLDKLFCEHDPALDLTISSLAQPERDRLMTVVSVLAHAYRWDSAPPRREAYELKAIVLPQGISEPWKVLAAALGQPRVGNLYSMVLANWSMVDTDGGSRYAVEDIVEGVVTPRCLWLAEPEQGELRAFLLTGLETEARGACAVRTVVELVGAAARMEMLQVIFLLERLRTEIRIMSEPFKRLIQQKRIASDSFLRLIQPTTIWGLDEGNGPLEGASGPQVGSIQCIDAVLGVPNNSSMARAVQRSRVYLPADHRSFLKVVDSCSRILREFVVSRSDGRLTGEFNGCLAAMRAWRLVHKARGATYLKPAKQVAGYASTGGVVELDTDRVATFEHEMDGRLADLAETKIEMLHKHCIDT